MDNDEDKELYFNKITGKFQHEKPDYSNVDETIKVLLFQEKEPVI